MLKRTGQLELRHPSQSDRRAPAPGGRGLRLLAVALLSALPAHAEVPLDANFDAGSDGFSYQDDAFRSTSEPAYAEGAHLPAGGFTGGGLSVSLGGVDNSDVTGISAGWQQTFSVTSPGLYDLTLRYDLTQTPDYESDELSQVMLSIDGTPIGGLGPDYLVEIAGNGNGGASLTTGWVVFSGSLGTLTAGTHTLVIGGYNSKKTFANESTEVLLDDVRIETATPATTNSHVQALVDALDPVRFKQNVTDLVGFGSRHWSQQGNLDAGDWIQAQLESWGYSVERHFYASGFDRENIYATKIGSVSPDQMYIVSAHMDSINLSTGGNQSFAPGANDDGSGTALVLEAARVFAPATVQTDVSIRFILWNNEETGLDGSAAYVADRAGLQGIETPPGSGLYPEPSWLGILQHDMIMFDHGLPPQPAQIPGADIDIEYQASSAQATQALALATAAFSANAAYATDYPAEVGSNMNWTDSKSFQDHTAAVSLRENQRVAEIGNGANPHWHQSTDVISTYSDADFLLGFNVAQTTVATIAELANATVAGVGTCGDGTLDTGEDCDDGNTLGGDCCSATCSFEAAGSACEDGDACTDPDTCDALGTCQGGAPLVCDDVNLCTDDSCSPASGCVFSPNTDPCDDGDACTTGDSCSAGVCSPGAPLVCDDTNLCTDDSCNPASGCVFAPNTDPCDDGDACTTPDICSAGVCAPGGPLVCDDANACTEDSCESLSGCNFVPITGCPANVPMLSRTGHALLIGAIALLARRRSMGHS
jgi:cysteine-rich repeat protein